MQAAGGPLHFRPAQIAVGPSPFAPAMDASPFACGVAVGDAAFDGGMQFSAEQRSSSTLGPVPSTLDAGDSLRETPTCLFGTVSRILAADFPDPGLLPPRPSCDLSLTQADVITTDDVLGQGAWGTVHKGMYLKQFTEVAVKFIHWNGEICELKSMQRELTVLARLKHPHILTMYGGNVFPDPEIFLVQELMAGSVSDILYGKKGSGAPGGRLSLRKALQIGVDVLKGLCYLHQHRVVHRDIKPDNILLTDDGVAKIGDFGLARFKINTMLQTRTLDMGTAAYMAPECFDSDLGGVTGAVDIYSFAITLWEMVMGERPYSETCREQAIMWQVTHEQRPALPAPGPSFPHALQKLITSCWAHQPEVRPSAQEALEELEEVLGGVSSP